MSNNPIQILVIIVALIASMWGMSELVSVQEETRNVILGIGFFVLLLLALWRKIPLDAKLLFIVILGYALCGKGFAYLTPFEPVYIGEICLVFCICGIVFRLRQCGLVDTTIHKLIWIYLIYAGVHLLVDFPQYELLAIRDSSTVYYSLYFFAAYQLFQNQTIVGAFERILKIALLFSVFQAVSFMAMDRLGLNLNLPGFGPHVDAFIPMNAAGGLYFFVKGVEEKKMHYLILGCFITFTLIQGKTTAFLAYAAVMGGAIFYGRVKGLLIPGMFLAAIGSVALAVVAVVKPEFFTETVAGSDAVQAFGLDNGQFVGFSGTSSWRWDWWMIIWDDTMAIAPFWGQGFGADLTTPFLGEWLGIDPTSAKAQNYARYPHNILFTIIGRLGLIGLFVFLGLFISIGLLALRFSKRYFSSADRLDADVIAYGIVVAGIVNGLFQATYEVPHSAITHWVCLGYMAVRYYKPKSDTDVMTSARTYQVGVTPDSS